MEGFQERVLGNWEGVWGVWGKNEKNLGKIESDPGLGWGWGW